MICDKCGEKNSDDNKYCIRCGEILRSGIPVEKRVCGECGTENSHDSKYCTECGVSLDRQESSGAGSKEKISGPKRKSDRQKRNYKNEPGTKIKSEKAGMVIGVKPLLMALSVLVISILVISVMNSWFNKSEDEQFPAESKSLNPAIEASVYDIASKFVCSCGSCADLSLEKCKCATAVEEREFVRDYLEKKNKPEVIVVALADRYGYLKTEYAKEYKVDSSMTWSPTKINSF